MRGSSLVSSTTVISSLLFGPRTSSALFSFQELSLRATAAQHRSLSSAATRAMTTHAAPTSTEVKVSLLLDNDERSKVREGILHNLKMKNNTYESSLVFVDDISDANVVVADPGLLKPYLVSKDYQLNNLKWVQSTWAGVDAIINTEPIQQRRFRLTRLAGVFGPLMAEYVLGHIIMKEREFLKLAQQQTRKEWTPNDYRRLDKLTIGILGIGDIGSEIGRVAKEGFRMTTWGYGRRALSPDATKGNHFDRIFSSSVSNDSLPNFLSGLDYLVNVLPNTDKTRDLLSGDVLSNCKKGCVFINVGRGTIINEQSILQALDKKWINGAVLDVFATEPLPSSSPLWSHPSVTITPHVAALSLVEDIADVFVGNLTRYIDGDKLLYEVDPTNGY